MFPADRNEHTKSHLLASSVIVESNYRSIRQTCRKPAFSIAVNAALRVPLAGAKLAINSDGKDRARACGTVEGTMKLAAHLFAALGVLLAAQTASAQSSYPNRPVKILVGFTPGTAPDLAARILADRFSELWGTPFVVEDVPGAGSNVATERVAKAAADGTTLLMGGNPSLVINPSLYEKLPFDPVKDFAPISQVFIAANVLAVPIELPVKTVAELVALAKAEPGKLSYAHAGVGTSQHLAAELFKYMAHVDIAAVPYRGSTALMPDLLAGRVNMSFANIVNVLPLAREGKLRALAITSRKRSGLAPELPTMAESGFPGFEAVPWFGLLAPAGTPKDVLDKLHDETVKTLAMPEVRKKFEELGLEPIGNTPAEFAAIIKKETPEWAKVIKDAGIKLGN
jgi:tripartite-type tricarboxylate transporter receptor subunit TctC